MGPQPLRRAHVGAFCENSRWISGKASGGRIDAEKLVVVHRLTTNHVPPSSCRGGGKNHNEGGKWKVWEEGLGSFMSCFFPHHSTLTCKY